jgi:hypothetical protein
VSPFLRLLLLEFDQAGPFYVRSLLVLGAMSTRVSLPLATPTDTYVGLPHASIKRQQIGMSVWEFGKSTLVWGKRQSRFATDYHFYGICKLIYRNFRSVFPRLNSNSVAIALNISPASQSPNIT